MEMTRRNADPQHRGRAKLTVLRPGLLTTVQDLGRYGFQKHGVNVGGAMDTFALRLANLLVGNPETAAALEATLVGPTLRFESDALVAIAGGNLTATMGDRPLPNWHAVYVRSGGVLSFKECASGCRAYVAVAGGIDVPETLGSRSTHLRARFGGLEGRALRAGDVLPGGFWPEASLRLLRALATGPGPAVVARWSLSSSLLPHYPTSPVIRVVRGTHFEQLDRESRKRFLETRWRVRPQSDRMGYRLEGEKLVFSVPLELISEAVSAGTVQLPPEGQPIALLADRQTTGGYPRIAHVITVDLPLLAQVKPGDSFTFEEVSLERAQELYLARERDLEQLRRGLARKLEQWGKE